MTGATPPVPAASPAPVDWTNWLARWDAQQTGYLDTREDRFAAMLEVLEVLLPETFVALDLCCGPGSISQRLLTRFPGARCIAVDLDPVLLAIGQGAIGTMGGRLRWVDADVTAPDWLERLGVSELDAVLSTTALHWLSPVQLARLYHQLGQLVRPGGVLLNGDHMAFPPSLPAFRTVAETFKRHRWDHAFEAEGLENWEQWWQAVEAEPALAEVVAERRRRFGARSKAWINTPLDLQRGALLEAGFTQVDVIWRRLDNHVLMAVK